MARITVKIPPIIIELNYYIVWYSKSKNPKTQRKLLIKCYKIIKCLGYESLINHWSRDIDKI